MPDRHCKGGRKRIDSAEIGDPLALIPGLLNETILDPKLFKIPKKFLILFL
jgi:hypothetical protein